MSAKKQKAAENNLSKKEVEIARLVESSPGVIYSAKTDGSFGITFITDNVKDLLGHTTDLFIKDENFWSKNIHPEDIKNLFEELKQLKETGSGSVTYRFKTANGTWLCIRDEFKLNTNPATGKTERIGRLVEVTEEREAQEKMELLISAFNSSTNLISITDEKNRFIYVNNAFLRKYGYNENEVLGKTPYLLQPPNAKSDILKVIFPKTKEGGWEGESVNIKKDGVEFPIHLKTSLIIHAGKTIGLLGIAEDISERKKAEEKLKRSENNLSKALTFAHLGYWEYDVKSDLFTFNDQFYKIFHATAEQVGGYTVSSSEYAKRFVHPDDLPTVGKEVQAAIETTDPNYSHQLEHRILYADGGVGYITVRIFVIKDSHGQTVKTYGINQDITELKLAEEDLQRATEEVHLIFWRAKVTKLDDETKDAHGFHWETNYLNLDKVHEFLPIKLVPNRSLVGSFYLSWFEEDRKAMNKRAADAFGNGAENYSQKFRLRDANDNIHWMEENARIIRITDKQFEVVGFIRDITDRKIMEEDLRRITNALRVIFWRSNVEKLDDPNKGTGGFDWKTHYINYENAREILSLKEYPGNTLAENYYQSRLEEDRIEMDKRSTEALRSGADGYSQNFRLQDADGKIHWMHEDTKINRLSDTQFEVLGVITDITDRKIMEETLGQITNALHVIFWRSNVEKLDDPNKGTGGFNWKTHYINLENAKNILSIKEIPGNMLVENFYYSWLEEDRRAMDARSAEALRSGANGYSQQFRLRDANDNIHWMHEDVKIKRLTETVFDVIGVITDITDRIRTEEALQETEKQYREVVENASDIIYSVDLSGHFTFANAASQRISGYSFEELSKLTYSDLALPEYKDKAKRVYLRQYLKKLPTVYFEFPFKTSSGEIKWFGQISSPKFEEGKIIGYHVIARDITERKHVEEALKESESRLTLAVESANLGLWDQNLKTGKIIRNKRWAEMLGYNLEEIESNLTSFRALIHPDDLPALDEKISVHGTGISNSFSVEHRMKTKGGDWKWILNRGKIIERDEDGIPVRTIGLHMDISERKKTELEIIAAKEKAEQSNKLKSEFLAQMSHEIRTPLNVIVNSVDLIKAQMDVIKVDPDFQDLLTSTELASQRIINTIDKILNMSELQTGVYEPILRETDLKEDIISRLYSEHKNFAENKGLSFTFSCKTNNTKITVDRYSVTQIFANLIDNAIKYTKAGKVEITMNDTADKKLIVEVKDTGVGISEEFIPRIFEPFAQEEHGYSRTYDGNGLGLALVKRYCDINNATISVESKKNVGSVFSVTFITK